MNKKNKIRKAEYKNAKPIVFGAIIFVLIIATIAFFKIRNAFDFTSALDKVAYTYQDKEVLLSELAYYIMVEEETVNDIALEYNAEEPRSYWNLHINHTFVSKAAAKTAREYSIRDQLYYSEAKKMNILLSEEEAAQVATKARIIVEDMTDKQRSVLQLKEKQVEMALTQNLMADKYVLKLAEKEKVEINEKILSAYYGINSNHFKTLMKAYQLKINEKLWEHISLGAISIN